MTNADILSFTFAVPLLLFCCLPASSLTFLRYYLLPHPLSCHSSSTIRRPVVTCGEQHTSRPGTRCSFGCSMFTTAPAVAADAVLLNTYRFPAVALRVPFLACLLAALYHRHTALAAPALRLPLAAALPTHRATRYAHGMPAATLLPHLNPYAHLSASHYALCDGGAYPPIGLPTAVPRGSRGAAPHRTSRTARLLFICSARLTADALRRRAMPQTDFTAAAGGALTLRALPSFTAAPPFVGYAATGKRRIAPVAACLPPYRAAMAAAAWFGGGGSNILAMASPHRAPTRIFSLWWHGICLHSIAAYRANA